MYKWNIDIRLKSGMIVNCEYDGPESNSDDVILKLFQGKQPYEWVPLYTHKQTGCRYIVVGEIAAVDIYERKGSFLK